jgi:AcrR family transcriptional regulator
VARRATTSGTRRPLTRDDVLRAAVAIADRDGVTRLSMRSLAADLGVEAMSLYHHVSGKDAILDGMVDLVFGQIHRPVVGAEWATELRRRSVSGREVLLRHRWAVGLMDSRSAPGPETLRHHDAVIGCLRAGGFSVALAAHAFAVLDAHLYGFLVQELSLPFQDGADLEELGRQILGAIGPGELPHFTELATEHALQPGYAFGDEFEWGLDLILEGLERRRAAEPTGGAESADSAGS